MGLRARSALKVEARSREREMRRGRGWGGWVWGAQGWLPVWCAHLGSPLPRVGEVLRFDSRGEGRGEGRWRGCHPPVVGSTTMARGEGCTTSHGPPPYPSLHPSPLVGGAGQQLAAEAPNLVQPCRNGLERPPATAGGAASGTLEWEGGVSTRGGEGSQSYNLSLEWPCSCPHALYITAVMYSKCTRCRSVWGQGERQVFLNDKIVLIGWMVPNG